jgi:chemotaxis protein CheX
MRHVRKSDIERVVGFVWETLAGCEVVRLTGDVPAFRSETRLASAVTLEGEATGKFTLACSLTLARRAAAHMFGEPVHEIELERVQDAVAELTNVVAGNLKSLVPGETKLGIPVSRLLEPGDPFPRQAGRCACRLVFRAGRDLFLISFQGRTS